MILIGQFDSPFVRRVAVSMHVLGIGVTRNPLSVFSDAEALRRINPLGRVPALVLPGGEVIVDSAAILDHLDEIAGEAKALLPKAGPDRRRALRLMAMATGINDKAIALAIERLARPQEKRHEPWLERNRTQVATALQALEADTPEAGWYLGARLSQPDITVACMLSYLRLRAHDVGPLPPLPRLAALSRRAEAMPAFKACRPTTAEIGGQEAGAEAALARFLGGVD